MAKKRPFTQEDMEKIDKLYLETTNQSLVLKDILLCLKGDESMNIEGVIPAQRRIEFVIKTKLSTKQEIQESREATKKEISVITEKVDGMQSTLTQLNDWKHMVSIYFGMMFSKKMWKFIGFVIAVIVIFVLSVKYGFETVWHYIKSLFI